jgi:hypothetical protein
MSRARPALSFALLSLLAAAPVAAQSEAEIAELAVRPLPEDMRADATVFRYDDDGRRQVLRRGTNHVECSPEDERGFTLCYPRSTAPWRDHRAKLAAEGLSGEELQAAMAAAERAGTVESVPFGSMIYRLYENDDRIKLLWVVRLPGASSAELGMPTGSQRDNALAGRGLPWMMNEGTPGAHLMIPINGTELSNGGSAPALMDTHAIDDPVMQATLPLPDDLRAGAAVVTYDPRSGRRTVLREGSNPIECQPRNAESGFTRCYHEVQGARRALTARLQAEGKTAAEVQAERAAALAEGRIRPSPMGSLSYRLYEEGDRIRFLWILSVPNATAEELGMPTGSQRDPALAGRGRPWMMNEGTRGAHLMIPINGTALSNR